MRARFLTRLALVSTLVVSGLFVASPAEAHLLICNSPPATNHALIWQEFGGKYRIAGSVSCEQVADRIEIKCWVVHRHSLYWHSHHDTDLFAWQDWQTRVTVGWGPFINGTRGDIYKTHCDGKALHGNWQSWSKESPEHRLW